MGDGCGWWQFSAFQSAARTHQCRGVLACWFLLASQLHMRLNWHGGEHPALTARRIMLLFPMLWSGASFLSLSFTEFGFVLSLCRAGSRLRDHRHPCSRAACAAAVLILALSLGLVSDQPCLFLSWCCWPIFCCCCFQNGEQQKDSGIYIAKSLAVLHPAQVLYWLMLKLVLALWHVIDLTDYKVVQISQCLEF